MKKKKSAVTLKGPALEAYAESQLKLANYQEAIAAFEKLLQTYNIPEWHQSLAHCYAQRSVELAAKGLFKEAVECWGNQQQHIDKPDELYDHYILCLIQSGDIKAASQHLGKLSAEQLDQQYPQFAAVLGVLILTKYSELQEYLAEDSLFSAHLNCVQSALLAYQSNEFEKMAGLLKQLPYRSAFKDLRAILLSVSQPTEQMQKQLARISVQSAYFQFSRLLLGCFQQGIELVESLALLNSEALHVITTLRQFDTKQLELIRQLSRQKSGLSDKAQLDMVLQYHALVDSEFSQRLCQMILVHYPAGKKDFQQCFGVVDEFEENRIKALVYEQRNEPHEADYYWRQCLECLNTDELSESLKAALILRRLAEKELEEGEQIALLIASLDYDASELSCYVRIIQYYSRQEKQQKDYGQWLTVALERFPEDVSILTLAVKAATENKTYQKAGEYALKILAIDPLNTFAKQTLFSSYLEYARRLMRDKKYDLVEKELLAAEKLNINKACSKQVQLVRALLCFANEDKEQGLKALVLAVQSLQFNPINMRFTVTMEVLLCGLPIATVLCELPEAKQSLLSNEDLSALISVLNTYAEAADMTVFLSKALDEIKVPLKKSLIQQEYSETHLLSLAKVLLDIEHFELLRDCAESAQQKYLTPLWVYYHIYAEHNGEVGGFDMMLIDRLECALEDAKEQKDYQTARLIEAYVERYYDAHSEEYEQKLAPFLSEILDMDGEGGDDPLDELFGDISEGVMIDINTHAESIMQKNTPEALIEQLVTDVSAKHQELLLSTLMGNPDMLSALVLLKASQELKVDIGISIDDIVKAFEPSEDSPSFSFPF